jgi:hypothetical protein
MRMSRTAARTAAAGEPSGEVASGATANGSAVPAEAGGATAAAGDESSGGQAAGWPVRLLALAGRNWLATILLILGLALRVLAQVSYSPALVYIDSVKYLYGAWPQADPVGYDAPLKALLAIGNLGTVEAVQHVLGLAVAVLIYMVLVRRGVPRWLSALAMMPVLLDGYQLQMESMIMPDVWFEAMIAIGLVILLWKPRPGLWACVAAGLVLGASATVRQVGECLIAPAVLYLIFAAGGWRAAIWKSGVTVLAFAVPIVAYCSGSYALNGHFWLSRNGDEATYGRMAALADCATLKLPSYERPLCPTAREQAAGPDWLDHALNSPLRTYVAPASLVRSKVVGNFNKRVVTQQPLRVISRISGDAFKLFAVTRHTSPGDTPIYRWQFQSTYPSYLPTVRLDKQGTIVLGLKLGAAGGPLIFRKLDTAYGGNARAWTPGAAFLRRYQLDGGFTPGPLLLLCLLAGLAGGLTVFRRRASQEQRALARGALLFVSTAVILLLISDLFEFSWRYQIPALVTLPPAGALGIAAIIRFARRKRADRATVSAQEPRVAARAG